MKEAPNIRGIVGKQYTVSKLHFNEKGQEYMVNFYEKYKSTVVIGYKLIQQGLETKWLVRYLLSVKDYMYNRKIHGYVLTGKMSKGHWMIYSIGTKGNHNAALEALCLKSPCATDRTLMLSAYDDAMTVDSGHIVANVKYKKKQARWPYQRKYFIVVVLLRYTGLIKGNFRIVRRDDLIQLPRDSHIFSKLRFISCLNTKNRDIFILSLPKGSPLRLYQLSLKGNIYRKVGPPATMRAMRSFRITYRGMMRMDGVANRLFVHIKTKKNEYITKTITIPCSGVVVGKALASKLMKKHSYYISFIMDSKGYYINKQYSSEKPINIMRIVPHTH
jgi:hypothetical protein